MQEWFLLENKITENQWKIAETIYLLKDCYWLFSEKKRICCKITYQTYWFVFVKKKGGGCRWYFLFYYHCDIHLQRWFFFQLFNWFQPFSSEKKFGMFQDTIRTGGNDIITDFEIDFRIYWPENFKIRIFI
jgi:hypothetical protein